jgi:phenylacetate-CoA ligase
METTMTSEDGSRFFEPDIETMSRDQIDLLQEARILQLVPYVYERSPLIREVWGEAGVKPSDIRSLADFKAKVPFIDKDRIRRFRDERNDPYGGLRCADPPHLRGVGFTTGTTGDPTPLPRAEHHVTIAGLTRELWQIGMRPGDYFGYMLFTFREGLNMDRWQQSGMRAIPIEHLPTEIPTLVELSRKFRPKALFMLSTPMIMGLQQYEQRTGEDLREAFSSYKGVVFGGERLSQGLHAVAEGWGLEVFQLTSLGDVSTAMECRAHDGMHTWEDLAMVEHLDPEGNEPVADGARGELVVTALADDVGPLIRFRTDDLIEFTRRPCSCGRTHGRLKPLGRKGDEMLIQGRSILPIDVFPLMENFPATRTGLFQFIRPRREADVLNLRVGYEPEALTGSISSLEGEMTEFIQAALSVPVKIDLKPNTELLNNAPISKIPRVTKS